MKLYEPYFDWSKVLEKNVRHPNFRRNLMFNGTIASVGLILIPVLKVVNFVFTLIMYVGTPTRGDRVLGIYRSRPIH